MKFHRVSTFSLIDHALFFYFDLGLIFVSVISLIANVLGFFHPWIYLMLVILSVAGLLPVIFNAFKSLIRRHLTIDLLASIALIFALLAREWQSAVFVSLMLASARLFARYTNNQAKQSIQGLLKLRPTKVHIIQDDGKINETDISQVRVGNLVIVESGERVAVDGIVESGEAEIDQSSLTGESQTVSKKAGDEILSSTLNLSGSLIIRAARVGSDTTFSKIIELVEKSQANKAPIASVMDRFINFYILATLIGAMLLYYFTRQLNLVLAVLLVTCADDLAVAIPLAFTAAIGRMAKFGIIVKGGNFLEGINKVKTMIFDKTGTITEGKPEVRDVLTFENYSTDEFLSLLGALERESGHPTAEAIKKLVIVKSIKIPAVSRIHEEPGFGIEGEVNGKKILAGKVKFLKDRGINFSERALAAIEEQKKQRRTITALGVDGRLVGFVSLTDKVKLTAREALSELKNLGVKKLIMLTGDNEQIAGEVAREVGIEEFHANLLPQDKLDILKKLIKPQSKLAMVGDGVNDAAALALADVGIAMGSIGADAAIESADIVLMRDDLMNLPQTLKLSRFLMKIVYQDLWIWGAVNVIGLVLALAGILGPSSAAAYNFLTDFLPLLNSMRLFGFFFKKPVAFKK